MPKGPRGESRPANLIGAAVMVGRVAIDEIEEHTRKPSGKVRSGLAGARERAENMTKGERSAVAEGCWRAVGMMDNKAAAIEKVIYNLLCERFSKEAISQVVVKPDHDSDGDPVLRIIVVLEMNRKSSLDSRKTVGLVRHIRSKLESESLDDFPMVSFVSKKEAGRLLETA